jgi:hypothetical protein
MDELGGELVDGLCDGLPRYVLANCTSRSARPHVRAYDRARARRVTTSMRSFPLIG